MQHALLRLLPAFLLALPVLAGAQPKIQLQSHATGFVRPVDIAHCGDSRLFIVEQRGLIFMLDSLGNRLQDTFLNIIDRVRSTENERGLLGLAFPPDYAQTGVFYVDYTRQTDGDTRVSRFSLLPGNPNRADPNSEEILLTQDQPYNNHNGGCLKFGPDGYLYISLGDGGSGGDPQNYGQTKNTFLGKILRIDVGSTSPGLPYAIPADNPFVGDPAFRPEVWSWGLRNPWRFSFDRLTGDMWIGDVGQVTREEIDFEPAGLGGRNYGWRCYEGTSAHNTSGCPPISSFVPPVFDYDNNSVGCSVTGGFIYRGARYSDLSGVYLFTDYCSGRWWATRRLADGTFPTVQLADLANSQYSALGEDRDGELYVAALAQGTIYRIQELCSPFQISGTVTAATCVGSFDGIVDLNLSGGTAPYTINWSNAQTDSTIIYLNPGSYSVEVQDGLGCVRRDTFEVDAAVQVPLPSAAVLSWTAPLPTAALLCPGDTVVLEASEAPTMMGYQWYQDGVSLNGATNRQLAATQAGAYVVEFSGVPCYSPKSEIVHVEQAVITVPEPAILINGSAVLCAGDSTTLVAATAPAGLIPQWYRNGVVIAGATAQQLLVLEAGDYSVEYRTSACAVYTASPVAVSEEIAIPVSLNFTSDTLRVSNSGWTAYQWYQDGAPIAGATDVFFVPSANGFYECILSSPNGCLYRPGLQVVLVGTGLPDNVTRLTLAPNPTAADVTLLLDLKRAEHANLVLQDARQRQIFSAQQFGQRIEQKIDLRDVPAGTYYLSIRLESGTFVRTIVKN